MNSPSLTTSFSRLKKVSWKWGTSEPTGIVAEMKTEGKLEIETKGKLVHKNADPSNPAVHVERAGNDVVKRASELTKLGSFAEGDSVEAHTQGEHSDVEEGEQQESTETPASKKKAPRKKSNAAATIGEKRAVEEATNGVEGVVEESTGKKTKKPKTTKAGEGGQKKGPGRPRKDSKAKKHAEGDAKEADAAVSGEGTTATKKRTPGRPKKSDASDHHPAEIVADADAPAANTRSKD